MTYLLTGAFRLFQSNHVYIILIFCVYVYMLTSVVFVHLIFFFYYVSRKRFIYDEQKIGNIEYDTIDSLIFQQTTYFCFIFHCALINGVL